jgi:threonine/homoserine/homoserine lactone efflux protein
MTIETACALLLAMMISAATPGPGVFACVSRALASGFRASLYVICGIVLGNVVFLILVILGLSAIAQILGDLFFIIKWVGGAYLVWLGWKMWTAEPAIPDTEKYLVEGKKQAGFICGLFVPFSNPKVILFYVSLLPSFVELSNLNYLDSLIAACLIAFALVSVLSAYAYLASRTRRIFASHRAVRNLNRGAGAAMMGAGVVIATQSN